MRRFVRPFLAALVALAAFAAPASAAGRHHRSHAPVRLVQLPDGGTLIHVLAADQRRTIVRSRDAIAAAAIRDVDADGDLDIVASGGGGLVVWRNLGEGRYALAAPPSRRSLRSHAAPGLAPARESAQSSGFDEQRQHLTVDRPALTTSVVPAIASAAPPIVLARSAASRTHAGRAPPALA